MLLESIRLVPEVIKLGSSYFLLVHHLNLSQVWGIPDTTHISIFNDQGKESTQNMVG